MGITKKIKIKELHMDIYMNEPYMLLARIIDEDVYHYFRDNRVILKNKDDEVIANISLDEVESFDIEKNEGLYYRILFHLRDIRYKILVAGHVELS